MAGFYDWLGLAVQKDIAFPAVSGSELLTGHHHRAVCTLPHEHTAERGERERRERERGERERGEREGGEGERGEGEGGEGEEGEREEGEREGGEGRGRRKRW